MMNVETTENEIRVEMVLKAPIEKVWRALTTQEGWSGWFSERVDGDFQPGGALKLGFVGYGEVVVQVVERIEESRFAYRWHPGGGGLPEEETDDKMTTVSFELAASAEGTKLVMVETGFGNLSETRRISALRDNTGGWNSELAELQAWVEDDVRQMMVSNKISVERLVKVPIEKAWAAFATTDGISSWFCERADGEFALDAVVVLHFGEPMNSDSPLKVIGFDPMNSITWLWHPGRPEGVRWEDIPEDQTTKVVILLSVDQDGTLIKVEESGFAQIPEPQRTRAYNMHLDGWDKVLDMVTNFLVGTEVAH